MVKWLSLRIKKKQKSVPIMKEIPQDTGVDTCAIKQENSLKKKKKKDWIVR